MNGDELINSLALKRFNSSAKSELIATGGIFAVGVNHHLPRCVEDCRWAQTLPVGNIEAAVHFGEPAVAFHCEWRLSLHD